MREALSFSLTLRQNVASSRNVGKMSSYHLQEKIPLSTDPTEKHLYTCTCGEIVLDSPNLIGALVHVYLHLILDTVYMATLKLLDEYNTTQISSQNY